MPTPTTVHDIDKPLGNENVTRAAYNAVLDELDAVIRGIIPMTAAQRDALTAPKKWAGRIVYVTDAAAGDEFQRWTGVAWSTDLFPRYSLDTDLAAHRASFRDHVDVSDSAPAEGQIYRWREAGGGAFVPENLPASVTDHGALTGLADDDHAQYYNQARGDARYAQLAALTSKPGRIIVPFSKSGVLAVANGLLHLPILGSTLKVIGIACRVATAPTGQAAQITLRWFNNAGAEQNSQAVNIADGAKLATAAPSWNVADSNYLRVDITQVGSAVAGADLVAAVYLEGR